MAEEAIPLVTECCQRGCKDCILDILTAKELEVSILEPRDLTLREDLLSKQYFKPFVLLKKDELISDVYTFHFKPCTSTNEITGILPYTIGQHLCVMCSSVVDKENVSTKNQILSSSNNETLSPVENEVDLQEERVAMRAYTPITVSKNEKNCHFEIFVKIYEHGEGSNFFNNLEVGNIVFWRGPGGSFHYVPNSFRYVLILCMGTGLAPMIPILTSILNDTCENTTVHLMYGVKNINQIIHRHVLKEMLHFWNFSLEYYFSENIQSNDNLRFREEMKNVRINKNCVKDYIKGKDLNQLLILMCGSDSFTSCLTKYLSDLGINIENNTHIF